MKFLLGKLTRQIAMGHICVPVLVPRLGTISRYIVTEIIGKELWMCRGHNGLHEFAAGIGVLAVDLTAGFLGYTVLYGRMG
jgi:hypothetical protein